MFTRWYTHILKEKIGRPFVHILFGARQTGKSTLINSLLPNDTLRIDLSNPAERSRHLADPSEFIKMCKAIPAKKKPVYIFVDETQTVPAIFDAVQYLYDEDKNRRRFILCGSSARKLRRTGANLLPGRSFLHHLYPLIMAEQPPAVRESGVSPFILSGAEAISNHFPAWNIEDRLAYGALPGVVAADKRDRADILKGYAVIYLEEEIRREALVKDWGAFQRFLRLAAAESGKILNYAAISQETGISQPTVKSYYQLLEDMFIGFTVPAFTKSARKNILSTPEFYFFDIGVRHAAAGLTPSEEIVKANPGEYFEQWVGIELWKRMRYAGGKLHYQRTREGAEVDFIVDYKGILIPVEVKWTANPSTQDARHLITFLRENPRSAKHGYVICRCPRPLALTDTVTAIPWTML